MKLIFVYNAKSGLIAGMTDSVHKTFSPATYPCSLCAITYGAVSMKKAWRTYLEGLPHETVFYHRDDFSQDYPQANITLPAILIERDGMLDTLVSSDSMAAAGSVDGLMKLLNSALKNENLAL